MIDLRKSSGLPIVFDKGLVFKGNLKPVAPDVRTLEQMRPVLFSKDASSPKKHYFMYRGVILPEDKDVFVKNKMRYDITVLPPAFVGDEFVKTLGHYHPYISGSKLSYTEVYEVISGRANYLLQRVDDISKDSGDVVVEDVVVVEAVAGDKVVIPPNYGHITINPGDKPLVMSNITDSTFKSVYGSFLSAHGGVYYNTKKGWVKNSNYNDVPKIRFVRPMDVLRFGLTKSRPLYSSFVEFPEKFLFLSDPSKFSDIFKQVLK
jgi:glucose-6-phosphate isomerase, archaeal